MENKLIDLNNHLFAEIERLGDEDLKGDKLDEEVKRAHAINSVAKEIISNAHLALSAEKLKAEYGYDRSSIALPEMLESKK